MTGLPSLFLYIYTFYSLPAKGECLSLSTFLLELTVSLKLLRANKSLSVVFLEFIPENATHQEVETSKLGTTSEASHTKSLCLINSVLTGFPAELLPSTQDAGSRIEIYGNFLYLL